MAKRRRRPARRHVEFVNHVRPFYDRLLEGQGGHCARCRWLPSPKRRLDIDHDHRSMRYRGLLCARCNRALPSWMSAAWLRSAADYLDSSPPEWLENELKK